MAWKLLSISHCTPFQSILDSFASLVVAFLVSKSHKVNYKVLGYFKMLTG